jgi:hypothetical protein
MVPKAKQGKLISCYYKGLLLVRSLDKFHAEKSVYKITFIT